MFVTITKDGKTFHKVTDTVYNKRMKKMGYYIVSGGYQKQEIPMGEPVQKDVMEKEPEAVTIEEPEIPVSDMSKEELAEFAKEHNIDTSKATNVRQARAIINAAIAKGKK